MNACLSIQIIHLAIRELCHVILKKKKVSLALVSTFKVLVVKLTERQIFDNSATGFVLVSGGGGRKCNTLKQYLPSNSQQNFQ